MTRCPFRHLQNSFETFLIFTPFFSLRGEKRRQKLSYGRLSPLSLSVLLCLSLSAYTFSFSPSIFSINSYLFSFPGLQSLHVSYHFFDIYFCCVCFLFVLFLLEAIKCSPHLPSSSFLLPEYYPPSLQLNSSKCPTEPSQTCPKHVPEGVCCGGPSCDLLLMVVLIPNTVRLEGDYSSYHGGFLDGTKTVDENVHSVFHRSSWIWKEQMPPSGVDFTQLLGKRRFSKMAAQSNISCCLFFFCCSIIN